MDLNPRANIIGAELVSIGTLDMTVAHPREIFAGALIAGASAIVLAHNHPSGDVRPSAADLRNFSRLAICGMLLGIEVRDQLIISEDQLFSLQASRQQREFPHGKGRSLLL